MVRIFFVNSFFYPDQTATSQLLTDVAFDCARAGIDVRIVTTRRTYDGAPLEGHQSINGVSIARVPSFDFFRNSLPGRLLRYLSFYIQCAAYLLIRLRPGDIVVVKTDPPLMSVILIPVVALRRTRMVNWLQDLYPEVAAELGVKALQGLAGQLARRLRNTSLRYAHRNIVIGELMAERLRAEGIPADSIVVQPNWTDDHDMGDPNESNPLRATWGIEGHFVLAYSGNLGRAHEIETFLGMAEQLSDQADICFLFIGGGHFRPLLEAETRRRGIKNILFKPHQDRSMLRHSLRVADVHWLSLRPTMEGLIVPSKFYGILGAGRPTIAVTDKDGEIARILGEHQCGIQVDVGDAAAFAAAVLRLKNDETECRLMGNKARLLLEECYTRTQALANMRKLLTSR